MSEIIVRPEQALKFCTEAFMATGVREGDGKIVAENLVEAELRGHPSHGLSRLKFYLAKLEAGGFNANPEIKILKDKPSMLLMDSDYSLGAVAGKQAMSLCIEKAKKTGFAAASVRKANHFGIAAFYAMMALEHDMIGFTTCNSSRLVAVHGGVTMKLGTNPIAIAVPAGKRHPLVFDAATSTVASGKMIVADIEGKSIPYGWALDAEGRPTTDPKAGLQGALLPLGGYKGSGLGIMVDVLSAVLSGAQTSPHCGELRFDPERGQNVGFFFGAIDVASFDDVDTFKAGIDQLIDDLKNSKKMEGVEEIFMPGEIEYRNVEKNKSGFKVGPGVYGDLMQLKEKFKVKANLVD
ncbi:MAG: Ldh family oxidoreductase [Negativicutes bacterium]|nr:Ldh family oxidoreductase [Negativicutes bacterium]